MTNKQRMLLAARGEMPDQIPFAPRLDIWYNANRLMGTLPKKYENTPRDDISRAEGWGLHKVIPEYDQMRDISDALHRGIGLYPIKEAVFRVKFSPDVEIKCIEQGHRIRVEYHTPIGMVSTSTVFTEEMVKSGATQAWVEEHVIKSVEDYKVTAYLFDNLELVPDFDDFIRWQNQIDEDGLAVTIASEACSPMHHIQKDFVDATTFFYHYNDHYAEMRALADSIENYYNQALEIISGSPAEAVFWGANIDSTITPPPYLKKEILPWIQKASYRLRAAGKIVVSHTDGENHSLMDLIRESRIDVADSVCPYPMTKVKIEEFYGKWSESLTIMGGIPSDMLIPELIDDAEFEAYLSHLFKAVVPGNRIILGIADTVTPNASFDRLVRIGERVAAECRLPLEGGAYRLLREDPIQTAAAGEDKPAAHALLQLVQDDVFKGDNETIKVHVSQCLEAGLTAGDILQQGMIMAMEVIGVKFKNDEMFMPEVLLSARAMNDGLAVLEPYLAGDGRALPAKVLIGTVKGDLHDIGKNMVVIMLRGVGFEVKDLGINVASEDFIRAVREFNPDILGLSALLTTTMPEMKKVVDALADAGLREKVKVMVGGAPVTENFARKIGADGYADEAGQAVQVAKQLTAVND